MTATGAFETDRRVRIPHRPELPGFVRIDLAAPRGDGWVLYVEHPKDGLRKVELSAEEAEACEVLSEDGAGDAAEVLAGLWTAWMGAAVSVSGGTPAAMASSPLRPYAHQMDAVYGAMLPQPDLRFLLADEPGTGKTVMAGLYLREMQRLGFVGRALVVAPAHLVSKWRADFERFFGGGLRAITTHTVREGALETDHDLWIVSLDLAAVNPSVQAALRPERAGWDAVVFDEAHRLTPTAASYYRVGELLAPDTPRALFMTATPHRGKEWLFRALLHLVDPEVYPEVGAASDVPAGALRPGRVHFLRRMKEDLVGFDGKTKLFKGREASNDFVPLNPAEAGFYEEALDLVDRFFPTGAAALGRMVYGKRAASSLYALAETLKRRREKMGSAMPSAAAGEADPDWDDPAGADEARVVVEASRSAKRERKEIDGLLARLVPAASDRRAPASKWDPLVRGCLARNGVRPGRGEQAVVFTEYADTADWLVGALGDAGFAARRYSGRDPHPVRDEARSAFARGDFEILVSTDAGNEGIDLQSAHVLVNWDIPWSLVRLEQRMGRIHRLGQARDVLLYNLVATGTREGDVLGVLLRNFVAAADRLGGRMFDSLSLVGELVGLGEGGLSGMLTTAFEDEGGRRRALAAAEAVTAGRLAEAARQVEDREASLRSAVDVAGAVAALKDERLERVNPAIVAAFLERLHEAGVARVVPHAAGDGIFTLALAEPGERRGEAVQTGLPREFIPPGAPERESPGTRGAEPGGPGSAAVVATSGAALLSARKAGADVSGVVSLGPGEPAFRSLVALCAGRLAPACFRGGVLEDGTSVAGYELFCYRAEVEEASGKRKASWSCLVRVDGSGARTVGWEGLANLRPAASPSGTPTDVSPPEGARDADAAAEAAAGEERAARERALGRWLRVAERELARLPDDLAEEITDRPARIEARGRLEATVAGRISRLREMSRVAIGDPERVAWARVRGTGSPAEPADKDSERISMELVARTLRGEGFAVRDVHLDGKGYDLHASRGLEQRLVEVKGVWEAASSRGVNMTGNEILVATQHAEDYWLYVVEGCRDGEGTLYGAYPDPVEKFGDAFVDSVVVRVPGGALKAARNTDGDADGTTDG